MKVGKSINSDMKVLVVDDFRPMRTVVHDMLKQLGFSHITDASDGNSALEKMRSEKIDLIISNCNMKPLDGVSLLKTIRKNPSTTNIPVILTTGKKAINIINEAKEYKVDNFIARPFDIQTFKNRLDSIRRFTPASKKKDDLFKIKKMLTPITVGIATLRTLEKLIPISSERVEAATEDIYTHFSTISKYINKEIKNVPPEIMFASSRIVTAMQFQDRNTQYMQNIRFTIQHCIGILKDIKSSIHEITNSGNIDREDSETIVRKIMSDIRLSEIKVLYNNILFGNGINYKEEALAEATSETENKPKEDDDDITLF